MTTNALDVFNEYSEYYDLFYDAKDYSSESQYFIKILKSLQPNSSNILELGSGSGNYASFFSRAGYKVTGIELSESMIARANAKSIPNFSSIKGNIASFNLHKKFDAAVSLFDVMSYLTKNEDIISCLKSVNEHLNKGGIFVFDSWHTAGVYTTPPAVNVKYAENDRAHITRIARPEMDYVNNTVLVNYDFIIKNKANNTQSVLTELHLMRHFSKPEIEFFANSAGFNLIKFEEPQTGNTLTKQSWKGCYTLEKI